MRRSVASYRRALEDVGSVAARLRNLPTVPNLPAAILWVEAARDAISFTAAPVFEAVADMDRAKGGNGGN